VRKINAKQLLAIAVCGLTLASCGGGGGAGAPATGNGGSASGSGTPTPTPPTTVNPISMNIYLGTDYGNEPIVVVYINGKPVTMLADTGASGVLVNQSAVSIPSSDFTSYTFSGQFGDGSTFSGTIASATVCINPSNTASCIAMPIGVVTSGNAFSTSGERQGDFGLDSGLNIMDVGYNSSGSSITGYSYPTYLAQQYGMNSYTLSFYSLSNTFYTNVSATAPIGQITFGMYSGNSNTLVPYAMDFLVGLPDTSGTFTSATSSYTNSVIFDTGSNFNFLGTNALKTEIPNFSQSADEGACANYGWPNSTVNGGFVLSYTLQNYNTSFTTEPSLSFCQNSPIFDLIIGNTFDVGSGLLGVEDFGLPEMLRHTFTWVLDSSGMVQDVGVE